MGKRNNTNIGKINNTINWDNEKGLTTIQEKSECTWYTK